MKRTQFLIVLALIGAAASFWQCGGDSPPAPDPQDQQLSKLTKTWKATSVLYASTGTPQPVTGYENFQLTMTGSAGQDTFDFSTSGRPSGIKTPWPASGKFTFGTNFETVLTRDDNIQVTYSLNTSATQLQMTFTYTGAGYTGRVNNVEGSWTFTFGL
ncbi:MAG: hypothetical protein JNN04_14745 [Cyclobacteriaceae bacterium]|nr:hypothetical protein [Cyclobacteriaceae bacterium]